jgi:hypothetical protein
VWGRRGSRDENYEVVVFFLSMLSFLMRISSASDGGWRKITAAYSMVATMVSTDTTCFHSAQKADILGHT